MAPARDRTKTRLALFCLLSCLAHLLASYLLAGYGHFDFAPPMPPFRVITVDLKTEAKPPPATVRPIRVEPHPAATAPPPQPDTPPLASPAEAQTSRTSRPPDPAPPKSAAPIEKEPLKLKETATAVPPRHLPPASDRQLLPPPIRSNGEFVGVRKEKLSYRVSLLGLPIGSAEMVATNRDGELRITTSARSNAAISLIYPVDNVTETRMFNGRYIMTTIRQQEGSYRNDVGFTLNLGEKHVFWTDRIRKRYSNEPLPTDRTMDLISAFFFLRNQPLEVGKTVVLPLYDSNAYSPTEVAILRRERLILPGSREADTLVIQPLLRTDGFFRRTGDLFVWLTDDEFKVPVKMEATVHPLGKVTAELVSSEVEK